MKTIQRDRTFTKFHHEVHQHLDPIDWFVFGTIEFNDILSHQESNDQRVKRFFALMNALAVFARVKTKKLVYFQNNEVAPARDFHHIHFLLARHGIERLDATTVCDFLVAAAKDFGMSNCVIEPYDPTRDGVGYVTKKVWKFRPCYGSELLPPDFKYSRGLVNLWTQKGLL